MLWSYQRLIYPDNGSVKILAGSQLLPNDSTIKTENNPAVEALRNELIETGTISDEDGKLIFSEDYHVFPKRVNYTALSPAADLILHGSHNGWECWQPDDGFLIKDSEVIKQK